MEEQILSAGTQFIFRVPDWFMHENEIANFIILSSDHKNYSIAYCNNKCSCKDGWIKFSECLQYPLTKNKIIDFLSGYYNKKIILKVRNR